MTGCLVLLYGQRWLQTLVRVRFDDASDFNVDWYATGELAQPSSNSKISSKPHPSTNFIFNIMVGGDYFGRWNKLDYCHGIEYHRTSCGLIRGVFHASGEDSSAGMQFECREGDQRFLSCLVRTQDSDTKY